MIELEQQFKIIVCTILFAMIFTNLYTLFDIMLRKSKIIRFFTEAFFFSLSSVLYYFFVYKINKGILNVYLPIALCVGYYLHMRFYDKHFSCLYKYLFSKLHSIIDKGKAKGYKIWKELTKKKTKKAKLTE